MLSSSIRCAAAMLAVLAAAAPAAADPMPMSAGDVPAPIRATDIALAREVLNVSLTRKHAEVTARLWLRNPGAAAAKLYAGFPCDKGADPGMLGLDCKTRVSVRVGGKKVAARREATAEKKTFWLWPMRIAAGAEVEVVVTYRSQLHNDRYEEPFFGMGTLYYRLATGAAWAGPIGDLTMQVELPSDAVVHISPPGYTRAIGTVTWHFKDYEPKDDVAILFHPIYLGRASKALPAKTPAELRAAVAKQSFHRQAAADVAEQMRADVDDLVEYAGWFHRVARARLGLPEPKEAEVRACVEESAKLIEAAARIGP